MTETVSPRPRLLNGWRLAGWGCLLALLILPALAMQWHAEGVHWTASDFAFATVLLGLLGAGAEIAFAVGRNAPHKVGIAIAALGGFLTVWINGAVGMLGSEEEPTNLVFIAMAGIGVVASLLVWFRAAPMRWIMATLSAGQFAVGVVAALWTMPGHAVEWGVLTFFALIWGAAAACFHAARSAQSGASL
ncbi:MAG: hypothetical protein JY451_03895 [Erythrobacter sp.]|nr:MAG: hypothetical protein JY451_03895 [Erythrobacter sp.]